MRGLVLPPTSNLNRSRGSTSSPSDSRPLRCRSRGTSQVRRSGVIRRADRHFLLADRLGLRENRTIFSTKSTNRKNHEPHEVPCSGLLALPRILVVVPVL